MDDGSLSRHGLASSNSWLDGIPFKIGPKFRPPPKVIYNPVIESSSEKADNEYTFETEDAVLAWAKAREEAIRKASTEQAQKATEEQAEAEKATKIESMKATSSSSNIENPANGIDSSSVSFNQTNLSEEANLTGNKQTVMLHQKPIWPPKPPLSKVLLQPDCILKPTPIQANNKNENESSDKLPSQSAVDVSMFESVDDPFDTIELQTINDMEELKVLLEFSSDNKPNKDHDIPDNSLPTSQNNNNDNSIYELAAPLTNCWETFEDKDTNSISHSQLQNQSSTMVSEPSVCDVGEYYVDLTLVGNSNEKLVNGVKIVPNQDTLNSEQRHDFAGSVLKYDSVPGIYKPVLPPISSNPSDISFCNGEITSCADQTTNVTTTAPSKNPFLTNTGTNNASTLNSKFNLSTPARVVPLLPPPKPARPVIPPTPRPRSSNQIFASSGTTADMLLLASKGEDSMYSRHSANINYSDGAENNSNSCFNDIAAKNKPSHSSLNQFTKYTPLPPAPALPPPIGLTDPYLSLSPQGQEFTSRVTSMGFLRAKVARAVQKFGQDEKEVLDHLFAADVLVEKKYAPVHVEAALQSCKNDLEKAERFLQMQTQLEELGFSSENVRDALLSSDLNHDKALDLLTA